MFTFNNIYLQKHLCRNTGRLSMEAVLRGRYSWLYYQMLITQGLEVLSPQILPLQRKYNN